MGFGQGLSGLRAQSQNLDVIGNNIANSATVGFKSSTIAFADVYASSRVGLGTQVAAVNQNFGIGTISNTGGQFDMAIDGANGLFRVVDTSGNVLYTRNGQFSADKEGYIVNAQGYRLTGYEGDSTTATPIRVPSGNVAPSATTRIDSQVNLDSTEEAIDRGVTTFDPLDSASFHHYLPVTVYDSQGNPYQVAQYFTKTGANEWEVQYAIPAEDPADPAAVGGMILVDTATLEFDGAGVLTSAPAVDLSDVLNSYTSVDVDALDITINYAGSTQFSGDFSYDFDQNGYPTGEYSSMAIAPNGQIVASYTNGETQPMGFLVLANFTNVQGLQPAGGNAWRETAESGQPILGTPGTNSMALVKGQAVEESNVDMGTELVNMIISQRAYQANAQTITTQSEILQTLLNIR